MASEKQIAANRANAKRSTGPKTARGKMKSSRNSYRHGLSVPIRLDAEAMAKAETVFVALVGDKVNDERLSGASEFALAHLGLQRIRAVRAELIKATEVGSDLKNLRRLVVLDRYEQSALTRRRRASCKL